MKNFTKIIFTFFFISMSCAMELTDSNAACFKTDRILAPQNKFNTEFSATFTDPKQLNSSVKLGKNLRNLNN